MIELMHTVSLIHDDVVDGSEVRRGVPSVNASVGNAAAVQAGDFLLSLAMWELKHYRGTGICELLATTARVMSEGELAQLESQDDAAKSDHVAYLDIIKAKTASLISASCAAGGMCSGLGAEDTSALADFGTNYGIAFQLIDDIHDAAEDGAVVTSGKISDHAKPSESGADGISSWRTESPLRMSTHDMRGMAGVCMERAKSALSRIPDVPAKDKLIGLADALLVMRDAGISFGSK